MLSRYLACVRASISGPNRHVRSGGIFSADCSRLPAQRSRGFLPDFPLPQLFAQPLPCCWSASRWATKSGQTEAILPSPFQACQHRRTTADSAKSWRYRPKNASSFDEMRRFCLWIDLPYQRPGGPLGPAPTSPRRARNLRRRPITAGRRSIAAGMATGRPSAISGEAASQAQRALRTTRLPGRRPVRELPAGLQRPGRWPNTEASRTRPRSGNRTSRRAARHRVGRGSRCCSKTPLRKSHRTRPDWEANRAPATVRRFAA